MEAEIVRKLAEMGITSPEKAKTLTEMAKLGIPVLSPDFAQLISFGVIAKSQDKYYLSFKGLKNYRFYKLVHPLAYVSFYAFLLIFIVLMLFFGFTFYSVIWAIVVSLLIGLPYGLKQFFALRVSSLSSEF